VRTAAETALGAAVAGDAVQPGGFSPGLASRLTLTDGRRVFVKAITAERDRRAPELYRREIEVMRALSALPTHLPAPRLQWSFDDGDWVLLVLDDVEGRMPREPWDHAELTQVLAALERLATALSPAPIAAMSIVDDLATNYASWQAIAADRSLREQLVPATRTVLPRLVALESQWGDAARGQTLLHADLRADNLLLTSDGVVVVDWPYAVTGAPWVDALLLLVSVAASGVDPEPLWRGFGPAADTHPESVNAVLAAAAGDWVYQGMLPPPPNLPTLRTHQQAKGAAALTWLHARAALA
jgi:aminoglycoside phosphotransferase (APT) family kinase protein